MKKTLMLFVLFISAAVSAQQYEYKIFTVVESVVPNGLGRSRMIAETEASITKAPLPFAMKTEKTKAIKKEARLEPKPLKKRNF